MFESKAALYQRCKNSTSHSHKKGSARKIE